MLFKNPPINRWNLRKIVTTRRFQSVKLILRESQQGFTLIEVLVALSIVAIALLAGMQASSSLVSSAQRQADSLIGHICAENELVKARLSRQLPSVGDTTLICEQSNRNLPVQITVRPTLNPSFRRIDVQIMNEQSAPLLKISTVIGRY